MRVLLLLLCVCVSICVCVSTARAPNNDRNSLLAEVNAHALNTQNDIAAMLETSTSTSTGIRTGTSTGLSSTLATKWDTFWYDMAALFLIGTATPGFRVPDGASDPAPPPPPPPASPSSSPSLSPSASAAESMAAPSAARSVEASVQPVVPKPSPPPCECTAFTCNVTGSGLYGFGENTFGQLNRLNRDNVFSPIQIESMKSRKILSFAFGWEHGIAVTECSNKTTLVCRWGKYNYHRLGGKRCFQAGGEPQQLEDLMLENGRTVLQVAAGRSHTLALVDEENKGIGLFAWGNNEMGQLGTNLEERSIGKGFTAVPAWVIPTFPEFTQFEPHRITMLDSLGTIKIVRAGSDHSAVLFEDGQLMMWGRNNYGQCGQAHLLTVVEPSFVEGRFKKISLGYDFSLALDDWGHVVVWGDNIRGQLGLPNVYAYAELPRPVPFFDSLGILDVAAGMYHAFAWSATKVYGWGDNEYGQLGVGSRDRIVGPAEVSFFNGMKMMSMAGGRSHSSAVTNGHEVYTWGSNTEGQLGVQGKKCQLKPLKVVALDGTNANNTVCGYDVTFVW